ncbi:hypothetical protein [Luteolibacter soli]|uniref:MacB-like periplasmic core domain-containing protein n=1 Tax=Luteolibacter soli TaxID=3135280 RepID=A0ABU9B092_9BACT
MLTVAVVGIIAMIRSVVSYEGMAHRDFGTPARIATIVEWFGRIEKRPATDFVAVTDEPEIFGFPETRVLPASAIPKEFVDGLWGTSGHSSGMAFADWYSVLAHYDEQHQLRAIEFYGSRYGAIVSRDPVLRPKMGGELHQLAGAPVFITARITGEPD